MSISIAAMASGRRCQTADTQSLRLRPYDYRVSPWQLPVRVETHSLVAVRYGYQVSDFDHIDRI
jgi:hypothetical protein